MSVYMSGVSTLNTHVLRICSLREAFCLLVSVLAVSARLPLHSIRGAEMHQRREPKPWQTLWAPFISEEQIEIGEVVSMVTLEDGEGLHRHETTVGDSGRGDR